MTGHIITQIFQYEIKDWTTEEVVAIGDYPVAQFEIGFDRSKKIVTLIEKERAQIKGTRKLPAYAHIDDGRIAKKKAKR